MFVGKAQLMLAGLSFLVIWFAVVHESGSVVADSGSLALLESSSSVEDNCPLARFSALAAERAKCDWYLGVAWIPAASKNFKVAVRLLELL